MSKKRVKSEATREKDKARYKKWVEANRDRNNENSRRYRAKRYAKDKYWADSGPKARALKAWMLELKSKPCTDCNNCFPSCCMDFDHRPEHAKTYNVGSMFAHHYSKEIIEVALAKCEVVCANCHRIRTRDRRLGSGKYANFQAVPEDTQT